MFALLVASAPRPHPLPTRGRGGATMSVPHLPPPSWGRAGEGGRHSLDYGARS
jgi:hypothetical protein